MKTCRRCRVKYRRREIIDVSFITKTPYKKNLRLADMTLRIAHQNLKASRILYANDFFPESVYLLQQSVEKGCKSFGYHYGLIDEKAGRKISHEPTKIYSLTFSEFEKILNEVKSIDEQLRGLKFIDNLNIPIFSHIDEKIQVASEMIKEVHTPQSPLFIEDKISQFFLDLIQFQDAINKVHTLIEDEEFQDQIVEEFKREIKEKQPEIISKIRRKYRYDYWRCYRANQNFKKILALTKSELIKNFKYLQYRVYISKSFLLLAAITQPNENSTRYASTLHSFNPLDYYSKNVCVVQNFSTLATICDDNLNALEKIFSYEENFEVSQ
jgi:hypothetical protein